MSSLRPAPGLPAQWRELYRLRTLLSSMTVREVRSRFTGTLLGVVWLYAQPLLTVAAYYLVFEWVLKARLGEGGPTRSVGFYLVVGMVPWLAFADAVGRAMNSLVEAGSLLQKNALPPALFPARAVAASAAAYLLPLLLLVPLAAWARGVSPALAWLPLLFALQLLLCFLLGYVLAILAAALRDVLQVAGFALSLGVFLSPVMFLPSMLPEAFRWLLWANPMTPLILGVQAVVLAGSSPPVEIWPALAVWLAGLALLLDRLIRRSDEHLVDWL